MAARFEIVSGSAEETILAGEAAGRAGLPGDFVALDGELGSGKTVFVKGMAKGLCVPDWDLVCSPTFTITSRYRGRLELLHVDAWRLRGESDIADLGFEEWVSERGVTAVEWAGRVRGLLPGGRLEVVFEHVDTGTRRITFNGVGSSGFRLVEEVKKNVSTGVRGFKDAH